MKLIVIGDFHGKFPKKLQNRIKKEKPDAILCTGDFPAIDKIRKIIFENWTAKKWWDVIGLKKAKQLEKESFDSGLKILRKLDSIGKKIFFVWGNADFYEGYRELKTSTPKSLYPGDYNNLIKKLKNIILIDNKKIRIGDINAIGFGGYLDVTDYIKNPIDEDNKKQQKRLRRYKKSEKKLKELFLNKKVSKNFMFLIHYTPYKIFDKVKSKDSPMYGKNVGWEPYNNAIKKYQPFLVICGHMHEYQGMKKLGKSIIVNPGLAYEGKAAIIQLDEGKEKVKSVKFIR